MAKVFLHTRETNQVEWSNEVRDFARVPVPGEYLALDVTSPWYRVGLVVHVPFPADWEAEVYAEKVDHLKVMSETFPRPPLGVLAQGGERRRE